MTHDRWWSRTGLLLLLITTVTGPGASPVTVAQAASPAPADEAAAVRRTVTAYHRRVHIRSDAALAVTLESGRTRFRSWENQRVAWIRGRHAGR